jgi:hypothetical protein
MTTRPGFIWSGSEWVAIGTSISPVTYQATEPSAPATGDIWIDADGDATILNTNNYVLKTDVQEYPHSFLTMGA